LAVCVIPTGSVKVIDCISTGILPVFVKVNNLIGAGAAVVVVVTAGAAVVVVVTAGAAVVVVVTAGAAVVVVVTAGAAVVVVVTAGAAVVVVVVGAGKEKIHAAPIPESSFAPPIASVKLSLLNAILRP
jgi:hypothetical protein